MNSPANNTVGNWTSSYFSQQNTLDECFGLNGEVKEHWKRLLLNADQLQGEELKNRSQELLKLLQENGVTYNVYNDASGLNRPWLLDTFPVIISKVDWRAVEKGMKQRAYVLNKIFEDIYGDRTLLKEGIIPPELIYGHSGFLRACDKIKLPGEHQLIFYAADLSRGPDGKVWVLRDRTQAPSGMGYALENRSALSRVVPELFKEHQVAKLGGFFNHMMQAFVKVAPQGKEQPRIVLLTPGPRNETYFEHAFLAYYLGFTLVQGEDLAVRDGFVWIKTVQGLEKVDIILRRVDDSFCDPLELREDSQLGIPGLLEVIRKGNVAVVNPLGSSILENTGLMAFMHRIFHHFIKEDPIFPMVATWWCGQSKELNYVLDHMDDLVIKKIDRVFGSETTIGQQLTKAQKEELKNKIKARPYMYVGQETVSLSTSPVYANEKLEPRYTVLRSYMVAAENGYQIMPGGLSRCSPEKGSLIVTNQEGGIAKDTWVETNVKVTPTPLHKIDLNQKALLPSRAAENLFWVGRYTQRVVRSSRFIRIALRNLGQTGYNKGETDSVALRTLLTTVTHLTGTYPGFTSDDDQTTESILKELHELICNPDKEGSLLFTVNNLLRATYAVRDKWSVDNWRIIDEIENVKRRVEVLEPGSIRHVFSLLDQLNMGLLSFLESNRQSMYRGDGWIMYRIGQFIEEISLELIQYREILTLDTDEATEFQMLEALLVSNQSLSNYRAVYRTYFDIAPAIDLLFLNKENPISILSQFEQLVKYLEQLPAREQETHHSELANIAFDCYSKVRLMRVDKLLNVDEKTGKRQELDDLCETLSNQVTSIAVKLGALYFSHSVYQSQRGDSFQLEV